MIAPVNRRERSPALPFEYAAILRMPQGTRYPDEPKMATLRESNAPLRGLFSRRITI